MRLSKATPDDFEFCKSLYGKQSADMIYRWEDNEANAESVSKFSTEFFVSDEMWARIKEEVKFTREKFLEQLSKIYMKILIIYDDKNNRIGYFQLTSTGTNCWKLEFMFLREDKQKFEVFEQALVLLSNSVKRVEVCIMDDKPKKLFLKVGFKPITPANNFYFFLEKDKRSE